MVEKERVRKRERKEKQRGGRHTTEREIKIEEIREKVVM